MSIVKRNSCCEYPTKTVFIDDGVDYLRSLPFIVTKNTCYEGYSNPIVALEYFLEDYQNIPLVKKCVAKLKDIEDLDLGELEKREVTHSIIDIDISAIYSTIYSYRRFEEVAVIVVDYNMPTMNGVEFIRKLKKERPELDIKIIMLTGEADYEIAMNAYYEGLIDKFIYKNESKTKLQEAISEMKSNYFQNLSKSIIDSIARGFYCCLNDVVFIDFFMQIQKKYKIVEYYLISDNGSYLMLDFEGKPYILAMASEKTMQELYDLALVNNAPEDIQQDIKERRKLRFLLTDKGSYFDDLNEWRPFLHPAKFLQGKNRYYYSIVTDISVYNIISDKITSYSQFLLTNMKN